MLLFSSHSHEFFSKYTHTPHLQTCIWGEEKEGRIFVQGIPHSINAILHVKLFLQIHLKNTHTIQWWCLFDTILPGPWKAEIYESFLHLSYSFNRRCKKSPHQDEETRIWLVYIIILALDCIFRDSYYSKDCLSLTSKAETNSRHILSTSWK